MCLYPKLILNKKYTSTKKNGGNIPQMKDERTKYVPVGCGRCIECLGKKKREWQIRMYEEIKKNNKCVFITLSFSNENLELLCKDTGVNESNTVATRAIRLFLERWRKKYKKSVKHWLITELGHPNHSERIHIHGLLWTDKTDEEIAEVWKYGNVFGGRNISEKTINYIIKYVSKIDLKHQNFIPKIHCSSGLGKAFIDSRRFELSKQNEYYLTKQNYKIGLPIYYRNKAYSEEERELLWLKKLDEQKRYVKGIEIDVSTDAGMKIYDKVVEEARRDNKRLGYGDDSNNWKKKEYNCTNHMLKKITDEQFRIKHKELFYKQITDKIKKEELKMLKKLRNNKK